MVAIVSTLIDMRLCRSQYMKIEPSLLATTPTRPSMPTNVARKWHNTYAHI